MASLSMLQTAINERSERAARRGRAEGSRQERKKAAEDSRAAEQKEKKEEAELSGRHRRPKEGSSVACSRCSWRSSWILRTPSGTTRASR